MVSVPGTAMRVFLISASVELARRDDHGAVALADGAAAGHQGVVVLQVGIGVEGDGGDVVEGFVDGALVEGLDVGESVGELVAGDADFVGGEAVEHEGVVGVGTVGDADFARMRRGCDRFCRRRRRCVHCWFPDPFKLLAAAES